MLRLVCRAPVGRRVVRPLKASPSAATHTIDSPSSVCEPFEGFDAVSAIIDEYPRAKLPGGMTNPAGRQSVEETGSSLLSAGLVCRLPDPAVQVATPAVDISKTQPSSLPRSGSTVRIAGAARAPARAGRARQAAEAGDPALGPQPFRRARESRRAEGDDPRSGAAAAGRCPLAKFGRHFTGVALELTPTADFKPIEARTRTRLSDLWSRLGNFSGAVHPDPGPVAADPADHASPCPSSSS